MSPIGADTCVWLQEEDAQRKGTLLCLHAWPRPPLCYNSSITRPPPPHMESIWQWMPTLLCWGKKVWVNQVKTFKNVFVLQIYSTVARGDLAFIMQLWPCASSPGDSSESTEIFVSVQYLRARTDFWCMQLVIVSFCLAESVYSHSLVADGREITLNIWDSPYSEVTDTRCHATDWQSMLEIWKVKTPNLVALLCLQIYIWLHYSELSGLKWSFWSGLTGFGPGDIALCKEGAVGRRFRSCLQHLWPSQFQHRLQAGPRHQVRQRLPGCQQGPHSHRGQQKRPPPQTDCAQRGGPAAGPQDGLPLLRGVSGGELPRRARGVSWAGGQDEGR